jgi:hypothetical protein
MTLIRSLKANMTREEAVRQFRASGWLGLWRHALSGPLRVTADFYIPFRLFQVEILNNDKRERRILGLDVAAGTLDPYQFPQLPGPAETVSIETRNCVSPLISDEAARELLLEKVRRLIFSLGFFRIRELGIRAQPIPGEIYVPYWVGFRDRRGRARISVWDAVRRRPEGAKVRSLLEEWISTR